MFKKIHPIIYGFIIFFLIFFSFVFGKYYFGGDLEAVELTNYSTFWKSLFIWHLDEGFGSTSVLNSNYSIIYYLQSFGSDIFGPVLSQNILYFTLFLIIFYLCNKVCYFIIKDKLYSYIFSLIFILSYQLGLVHSFLLPFIFFNTVGVLLSILYFFEKDDIKQKIILLLLSFVSSIVFKNFANYIILGLFFLILSYFKIKKLTNKKKQ